MDRDAEIAAVVAEVEAAPRERPPERRTPQYAPGRCPSTTSTAKSPSSPARPAGSASRRRGRCTCAAPRSRCSTSTPTRRARRPSGSAPRAIGLGRRRHRPERDVRGGRRGGREARRARRRRRQRRHRPEAVRHRARASPARNGNASSRSTCSGVWRTVRAALPQIVERQGQMVVVSSVYAFANGMGNSPYAVAKAGVEALGRSLRVELAPHGASASVAYFGWVDTKLVQDAFDQEDGGRIQGAQPRLPAEADHPRRGRRRPGPRDRGTRPARLRPQVVALRLRLPRPDQPPAGQPHGERRQDARR